MKAQVLSSCLAFAGLVAAGTDPRDRNSDVWANTPAGTPASIDKRAVITKWDPPANLVQPLTEVWNHTVATYGDLYAYKNRGLDVLMAGKGKLNYCVRWDSTDSVTAEQRAAIKAAIQKGLAHWLDGLTGFMGWPYDKVAVDVVGWAVRDKNLLKGDTSDIQVYTNKDSAGVPECDERCGRVFHQDNNYSGCPAGAARHYDTSLWLKQGLGMQGWGADDWQEVGAEWFLSNLDQPHIFLHEFGHFLSLDDFYDWTPTGEPNFIMKAGSSLTVTDFDIWMMRDWWRHLSAQPGRYSLPSTKVKSLRNRVPGDHV